MAISPRGYYDLGRVLPRTQTRQAFRKRIVQQQPALFSDAAPLDDIIVGSGGALVGSPLTSVTVTLSGEGDLSAKAKVTASGLVIRGSAAVLSARSTVTVSAKVTHVASATIQSRSSIIAGSTVQHAGSYIGPNHSTITATGRIVNEAQARIGNGLALQLKLEEGTGTTFVQDEGGLVVPMSGFSNIDWVAGATVLGGSALHFDGTNNYLSLPDVFNFPNYRAVSISLWFKTTSSGGILGQGASGAIPSLVNPGGYVPAVYVDSTGRLRSSIFWHGSTTLQNLSLSTVNDGVWHHLLATCAYNLTSPSVVDRLYIDGVLQGSQIVSNVSYTGSYMYWLGVGFMGAWPNGNGGWYYFNGDIDDFRVYQTEMVLADAVTLAAGGDPTYRGGHSTMAATGNVIYGPGTSGGVIVNAPSPGCPYETVSSYGRFDLMDFGL